MMPSSIITERTVLRQVETTDAQLVASWKNDPLVRRMALDPETEITEEKQVAWCGCKQSKTLPFCDGTHRSLA